MAENETKTVVVDKKQVHGFENFISLLSDGVRPVPDIVDKLWYYVKKSVELADEEDNSASDSASDSAVAIGWVLGLSEEEVETLICAECIKYFTLDKSIADYKEKSHKRIVRMKENMDKRKAMEGVATAENVNVEEDK